MIAFVLSEIAVLQFDKDEDDQQTKNMAHIIFESALLESGYTFEQP